MKKKFGLSDLEDDFLTSTASDGAGWILSKIAFFKSMPQAEKDELCLNFVVHFLEWPIFNPVSSEAT